jgi:hypothetical protein
MKEGDYRLAVQKGQKSYFAHVKLTVEHTDSYELKVDFDPLFACNWQVSAQFGIEYAWEHAPTQSLDFKGINVLVSGIEGYAVDTTSIVVAFVAMKALWKALDLSLEIIPVLDEEKGIFMIPK